MGNKNGRIVIFLLKQEMDVIGPNVNSPISPPGYFYGKNRKNKKNFFFLLFLFLPKTRDPADLMVSPPLINIATVRKKGGCFFKFVNFMSLDSFLIFAFVKGGVFLQGIKM